MQVTTIGLDIAKNVFQVHGVDRHGKVVLRKRLARARVSAFFANLPRCVVGLEACGGAHHWARELTRLGHDARLMPPQYVKAYVKTNKHDAADAEACCEAVQRPSMRFVPVKSEAQQATCMLHRVRDQLIGQRTATINALRGHLAELGYRSGTAPGRPAPAAGGAGRSRGRAHPAARPGGAPDPGRSPARPRGQARRARPALGRDDPERPDLPNAGGGSGRRPGDRHGSRSRPCPMLARSARGAISRPGSAWYPNSTPPAARNSGSA